MTLVNENGYSEMMNHRNLAWGTGQGETHPPDARFRNEMLQYSRDDNAVVENRAKNQKAGATTPADER